MEIFNINKHVSLITRWWLQDPELVALLKKDRGYTLPADWIRDLERTKGLIFANGVGEIRDVFIGERSKEAEIFYYSPDKVHESLIAQQIMNKCFQKGVTKIRVKQIEVKEQILTQESISKLANIVRGSNGNTISNKNGVSTTTTSITDSQQGGIHNGHTATPTSGTTYSITESLPTSTPTISTANKTVDDTSTQTSSLPAAGTTTSKKSARNNIRTKKLNTTSKKKQSIRKQEQKEPEAQPV